MPVPFCGRIPDELAAEARDLLRRVRASPDPRQLRGEGVAMVLRLTEANLDWFFLRSVRELGLGRLAEGATRVGLKTALGGISLFVRRIAGGLSDEQMLRLADLVDEMLGAP